MASDLSRLFPCRRSTDTGSVRGQRCASPFHAASFTGRAAMVHRVSMRSPFGGPRGRISLSLSRHGFRLETGKPSRVSVKISRNIAFRVSKILAFIRDTEILVSIFQRSDVLRLRGRCGLEIKRRIVFVDFSANHREIGEDVDRNSSNESFLSIFP